MIRVMLVDDHAVVRVGFRMLLQAAPAGIEIVAEAESGEQALAWLAAQADREKAGEAVQRPDVLLLDLSMPGMGGLEMLRRLHARDPALAVLVLSAHEDTAHARRVLAAGALGYLSKRSAPEALVQAVGIVAGGQRYIEPALAQKLALAQLGQGGAEANPVETLSEREFAVFVQLAKGASVATIAQQLHLSSSTVGTHLYNIKQKLGASNQAELTLIALRWGVIEA
jgi:two-component system invasion response regulator UvrY